MRAIALDPCARPPLRPLPESVAMLLAELDAPPRLAAHLRAVHDVAARVVAWLEGRDGTRPPFDPDAVRFGAATHDIGKVLHRAELSGPGDRHEEDGPALLVAHGVEPELARFAGTHARWDAPGVGFEDLLVALADKVWKNKRVADLEDRVVVALAECGGRERWEEFLALDEVLSRLGDGADGRLAYQAAHPL
ncbi:phosphohydrolase [Streptacidiphilus sp. NEAU-YB345]|uniref:Phosphohydrolase n=1 Tax=Streptacidiphilus fuscans TaxID=2789292 RepID=A0A931B244_9ACTN|nr:phosphohydrolase [Streptacidiphilus fuscans]